MNLKEVAQWLLDNKYAVIMDNQLICTHKLNLELFGVKKGIEPEPVAVIATPIVKPKIVVQKVVAPDNKKEIWNEFIERAAIPHRTNSPNGGGSYTIRQYNLAAVNKLISIIKTPGIEYDRLVDSTKHYYATISYKATLSNYLLKEIWKGEYENYSGQQLTQGGNRFED